MRSAHAAGPLREVPLRHWRHGARVRRQRTKPGSFGFEHKSKQWRADKHSRLSLPITQLRTVFEGRPSDNPVRITALKPRCPPWSTGWVGRSFSPAVWSRVSMMLPVSWTPFPLAQHLIHNIQPDLDTLKAGRPKYASDPDSLIAASQMVAIEFQTIAAANNYWRK